MPKNKNNPPAFPNQDFNEYCNGMTLRDYFAAKAMQGQFIAGDFQYGTAGVATLAKLAYEVADALLAERLKTPTA